MTEKRIFPIPDDVDPMSLDDWDWAAMRTLDMCEKEARVAIFGALRRAATFARCEEIDMQVMKDSGHPGWINAQWRADEIRQVIRAAIGSPKAA